MSQRRDTSSLIRRITESRLNENSNEGNDSIDSMTDREILAKLLLDQSQLIKQVTTLSQQVQILKKNQTRTIKQKVRKQPPTKEISSFLVMSIFPKQRFINRNKISGFLERSKYQGVKLGKKDLDSIMSTFKNQRYDFFTAAFCIATEYLHDMNGEEILPQELINSYLEFFTKYTSFLE